MVIYDYNKTGREIVKQETVHEYQERHYLPKKYSKKNKRGGSTGKRIDLNWNTRK